MFSGVSHFLGAVLGVAAKHVIRLWYNRFNPVFVIIQSVKNGGL